MVDVVVVGGGHNGLTAAALLAQAGREVVVVERRDRCGGIAAGEPIEGAPDAFQSRGVLHDSHRVRPWVVDALDLAGHGVAMRAAPDVFLGRADGDGALLGDHPAAVGVDAEGLAGLRSFIARIAPLVRLLVDAPPANIGDEARVLPLVKPALGLRRLGKRDMMELLRVAPACVDDWVTEHLADPALRAALCARALPGAWMGPRSPTSTALLLLGEAMAGREVVGGPAALATGLEAAARAGGVEIATGKEVVRIRIEQGEVVGVDLADGTSVDAPVVLSAVGPKKTLMDLVPPIALPARLENEIRNVRRRGTTAKVHLALSGPLLPAGASASTPPERLLLGAEDPLDLERAFDDVKHRRLPSAPPPLDVRQWPTGEAGWVASILVRAPFDLDGAWTPAAADALGEAVVASIARYAPAVRDLEIAREVITPADLQERWGLRDGHVFHGEHALDQLWALRPVPRVARYSTSIHGLFLGSSGMHPGFGVTCGPGGLAAKAVLAAQGG